MGLWLFYSDDSPDDIEAACKAAEAVLNTLGFTAEQAQNAALAAADLTDETGLTTPNSDAVGAWFNAEDAALQCIFQLTGEWPHQASLVYTDEEETDGIA